MGLLDDIEEFGEDVGDGIKNGAQAIGQAAEDAWNEVTGAGEDAANAAGEAVEDGWNTLTQLAEDAVDKANDLVKDAADAAAKLADALEHAAGDVYHAGTGVVDAIAGGVVDAGEWGIGAFETVGSGIGEGLEWVGNEYGEPITSWVTDTLSDYGKEIGAAFAGSFISSLFGGSGENKEQGPVADGSDIGGPYSGGMAGADSGKSEVGTVGQALSTVDDGGSSFFGNLADASHDARGLLAPDLSNILTTLDEARSHTGFGDAALADGGDGGSSVGLLSPSVDGIGMPQENGIADAFRDLVKGLNGAQLPNVIDVTSTLEEARSHTGFGDAALADGGDGGSSVGLLSPSVDDFLGDLARQFGVLGDASDAGIIVVGGHGDPVGELGDANSLLDGLLEDATRAFSPLGDADDAGIIVVGGYDPGEALAEANPGVSLQLNDSAPAASFADSQTTFVNSLVDSEPKIAYADIASDFSAAHSHPSFAWI